MADLESIVDVTVTRTTATVSRAGFSVPLIAAFHTKWADRVRTYSGSTMRAQLITEGFSETDPVYLAAQAILAQNPRPRTIKIGRLDTTWTASYTITPTVANTTVYSGRVNDQPWTFTSDGTALAAEVTAGIAAAITALTGVSATAGATTVTVLADTAAKNIDIDATSSAGVYSIVEATASSNLATELTVIRAADNDFYGLVIDQGSNAAILAAAAWAEAEQVLFFATSSDSDVPTNSSTDTGSDLEAAGYDRTALFYHPLANSYLGAAVLASILPYDPGTIIVQFRDPKGVTLFSLSSNQEGFLDGKNVNYLDYVAGRRIIAGGGKAASGYFLDLQIAEDWVKSSVQEDVFAFLAGSPKIPYTDRSVERLKGVIKGVLQLGVDREVVATDPAYVVDAPKVLDVSPTDRANRFLPDVTAAFRLTGAIQSVDINLQVSV